jgi:tetratricopeptide (TPR) repeat protein
MRKTLIILSLLVITTLTFGQNKDERVDNKNLEVRIEKMEYENQNLHNQYSNLTIQYQQTNDRLNNYLTFTAIVASIFGVLIALAGIYIGFESLRSQNRRKDAIKTLEDAKNYVNDKKSDFDNLLDEKKKLLQSEYDKLTQLIKDKLLSDIEIETSKVREVAVKKAEEIQNLSVEQQTNKTIELLEKRLEFFENVGIPDDPEILFSKAKILREKKMHQEAILLLEKLVEKVPTHKDAYWYLGYEYAELSDNENSIKNYKKELELNPTNSSALNNIALRYRTKGNFLEALECLNKAIENSNKKELYFTNRIDILKKLNSYERAINDYISLININPDKSDYYNELIKLLRHENRYNDTILYFDRAISHYIENDPELSNSFNFSKASFLGEIGKEQSAIDIFQSLIDNNYKTETCYIRIADLKSKIGKTDEAIEILSNGISNNPLSSALYIYKAFIESDVSEANSKKTIDVGGEKINTENYYFTSGRFFYQREKFALARHSYEGALKTIEPKLKNEEIEEGDLMNYYETLIILQKSLKQFNEHYRKFIVSEKYLIVLNVLDIINKLYSSFNDMEKSKALLEIKELNIEAKDKDSINWNFNDIKGFVEKTSSGELAVFTDNLIKYIKGEISLDEL